MKKSVAAEFGVKERDPKEEERRNQKEGSKGVIICNPRKITGFTGANGQSFTIDFLFEKSQTYSLRTKPGEADPAT